MPLPAWASPDPDEAPRSHLSRIGQVVDAVETTQGMIRRARAWYRAHTTYVIRITSDDATLYREVQARVVANLPPSAQRALRAYITRDYTPPSYGDDNDGEVALPWDPKGPPALVLRYAFDAKQRTVTLDIDGHPIRIAIEANDPVTGTGPDEHRQRLIPDKLRLEARDLPGLRALQAWLQQIVDASNRKNRNPSLHVLNPWGSWACRADKPWRSLDTVILAAGQREALVDDLSGFLTRENTYIRNGWPWHRGFLLSGPPGTGKTSLVAGLAHHFGLDLWSLSLADLGKDANLLGLVAEVGPRSILLIEDIDAFRAATTRNAEPGEVSLSGLLNAIDGVATPHGLITFFTSNHPDKLDPALTRSGRIDVQVEIGLPEHEQIIRLFTTVYGRPPRRPLRRNVYGYTTADLMEVFKRHIDDPDGAERAIHGLAPLDGCVLEGVTA